MGGGGGQPAQHLAPGGRTVRCPGRGERPDGAELGRLGDVGAEGIGGQGTAGGRGVDAEEVGGVEAEDARLHVVGQRGVAVLLLELGR